MSISLPSVSVVIRTKDEADRLRLTLVSLMSQKADYEVVVVNDGSSDHTPLVLAEAKTQLPLTVINHQVPKGRSAASNAGAFKAAGDVLVFLDGDTLAAPRLLELHARLHAIDEFSVGRGDVFHLRCTRHFRDPSRGVPWAADPRTEQRSAAERARMMVTPDQIRDAFDQIEQRASPSIYPGMGPRRLHDIEVETLRDYPNCAVNWCAATGSNMSVKRKHFLRSGGYNDRIDINEHRELALRLVNSGARMKSVPGAGSFHLTHRTGWRDPLKLIEWEAEFIKAHPIPAVALMSVFWGSLSATSPVPLEYRIQSLIELEVAATQCHQLNYDVARKSLGLQPMGNEFWGRSANA